MQISKLVVEPREHGSVDSNPVIAAMPRHIRHREPIMDLADEMDVDLLNDLVTTTIDSAYGFERAAEDAQSSRFRDMFRSFAAERRQCVASLQEQVRQLGGTPHDDGSLTADLHRRWLDLRDAVQGGDAAIVEEVERGEDHINRNMRRRWERSGWHRAPAPRSRRPIARCATAMTARASSNIRRRKRVEIVGAP